MTDGDALLRAVLLAPADDAPRLVYADWLDEHDQADRAEVIRVQIQIANTVLNCDQGCAAKVGLALNYYDKMAKVGCPACADFGRQKIRDHVLLTAHPEWSPFPRLGHVEWGRGFLSLAITNQKTFIASEHLKLAFQTHPITRVVLDRVPGTFLVRPNTAGMGWYIDGLYNPLWNKLVNYKLVMTGYWKLYDTTALALQALSDAAVVLGREAAGLT